MLLTFDPFQGHRADVERLSEWQKRRKTVHDACERMEKLVSSYSRPEIPYPVAEVSILLVAKYGNAYKHLGTGAMLAPGCAIATRQCLGPIAVDPSLVVLAIQVTRNAGLLVWTVKKIEMTESAALTHLAFLHLEAAMSERAAQQWQGPIIRLSAPHTGETVLACSFGKVRDRETPEASMLAASEPYLAWGIVERGGHPIYNAGVNPSVFVGATVSEAFGDGPLFSEQGELCGFVLSPEARFTSDGYLLLPASDVASAMLTLVTFPVPSRPTGTPYPAFHLFRHGRLRGIDSTLFSCDWDLGSQSVRLVRSPPVEQRI